MARTRLQPDHMTELSISGFRDVSCSPRFRKLSNRRLRTLFRSSFLGPLLILSCGVGMLGKLKLGKLVPLMNCLAILLPSTWLVVTKVLAIDCNSGLQ